MARGVTTVGADPFDRKYAIGGLSDDALLTNIRLYGNEVVPMYADSSRVRRPGRFRRSVEHSTAKFATPPVAPAAPASSRPRR
jgi:hypothetical protein